MPRYYCDYCDTYLTHDSVRKPCALSCAHTLGLRLCVLISDAHNRGWKHRENVKLYYEQFLAGQGGIMTHAQEASWILTMHVYGVLFVYVAGEWLRAAPAAGSLPPRPMGGGMGGGMPGGMYPPRGPPPRGMMPPGGPGMMRPPPFHDHRQDAKKQDETDHVHHALVGASTDFLQCFLHLHVHALDCTATTKTSWG
ncbi:U1 small nuclear ribonucleoprotein c, partial [Globisporangium splendens]